MSVVAFFSNSSVGKLLAKASGIAGAALGIAMLAFGAGLIAQRAQYRVAGIPFVFIDYWAYAELGMGSVVDSLSMLLSAFWFPVILVVASVLVVFAFEFESFKSMLGRAHWVFLATLFHLVLLVLLVWQQLAVTMSLGPKQTTEPAGQRSDARNLAPLAPPVKWPFEPWVSPELKAPKDLPHDWPATSAECWRRMADEIKATMAVDDESVLPTRPRPIWAVQSVPSKEPSLLGTYVDTKDLDAKRALDLYRAVFCAFVFLLWSFGLIVAWHRYVLPKPMKKKRKKASEPPPVPLPWLERWKEEMEEGARFVLRPVTILLLFISGAVLMPECYGALAMPFVGKENVEITLRASEKAAAAPARGEDQKRMNPGAREVLEGATRRAAQSMQTTVQGALDDVTGMIELAKEHQLAQPEAKANVRKQWEQVVRGLEEVQTAEAGRTLHLAVQATGVLAPELSGIASDAQARLTETVGTAHQGNVLHYPRSDVGQIELIRRNLASSVVRWSIVPLPMDQATKIRVMHDAPSARLIRHLHVLGRPVEAERLQALAEVSRLGHRWTLEVFLAGLTDPSPYVARFCATSVMAYAQNLRGSDPTDRLRRERAARLLLAAVNKPERRPDLRGDAAKAIGLLGSCDTEVTKDLRKSLKSLDLWHDDRDWVERANVLEALASLRDEESVPDLLQVLEDSSLGAPPALRRKIPPMLALIGDCDMCSQRLASLLQNADENEDAELVTRAIEALGELCPKEEAKDGKCAPARGRQAHREQAVDLLCGLSLAKGCAPRWPNSLADHQSASLAAMLKIGMRRSLPCVHELLERPHTDLRVKAACIQFIAEMQDEEGGEILLKILLNDNYPALGTRIEAARALGRLQAPKATRSMIHLASRALAPCPPGALPSELMQELMTALEVRGRNNDRAALEFSRACSKPPPGPEAAAPR